MMTLSEISILVVDESDYPRQDARVTIYWEQGGYSEGRTGKSGQVVLSNQGTVNRITVHDKVALLGPVDYPTDTSIRLKT